MQQKSFLQTKSRFSIYKNQSIEKQNTQYKMLRLLIILLSFALPSLTMFNINLTNPFLLTTGSLNITTIDPDLNNYFLVGFQNGQARRYSSDFSSFTELAVPEPVNQFRSWELQLSNIMLSNGTLFSMSSTMTSTLSNSFTILRAYSYLSFGFLERYMFSQPVLDYRGLLIGLPSSMNPFHIVVLNQTIKVVYKNITTPALDITQTYGGSAYTTSVCFSSSSVTANGDYINMSYTYFQTITTVGLFQTTINLTFRYNFTSYSYDLTVGSSFTCVAGFSYWVNHMLLANGVLLMQVQGGGLMLRCGSTMGYNPIIDINIGTNPILKFEYINASGYYILYSSGVVQPFFSTSTAQFQTNSSLISSFPNNTYNYVLGSSVTVFYSPMAPYIYKVGCSGQYTWDYASCTYYGCVVGNCAQCPLTASTCQTCNIGYIRNDSLLCIIDNSSNTTNTTANTTTNSTSINSTLANTTTNGTNATSINSTNNTLPNNSSNGTAKTTNTTNTTLNNTAESQSESQFSSIFPLLKQFPLLQGMFFTFQNTTQKLISIPSARQLAVWFYFFGNFDDLYLYMFHDRLYGPTFTSLFEQVNTIETEKWNALNFAGELNWLSANSSLTLIANYQQDYLTYAYNTPGRPSGSSEGLLANCKSYFVVGIPMLIIGFILLRWLFGVLWRFPVSRLLRRFDFWGFLFFLIFQGNIQQFAFYVTAELRNTFSFKVGDRVLKAIVIYFGFLLVVISVGGFFIAFGTYRKLNRHLTDNNRNTLRGISFLVLQEGVRNLLLGALHSILRTLSYYGMLSIFVLLEGFFLFVFTMSVMGDAYKRLLPIWTYLTLSLIRLLLISTLFLDYSSVGDLLMEKIQCILIILMISVYLLGTFTAVTASVVQLVSDSLKICRSSSAQRSSEIQRIKLSNFTTIIFHHTTSTTQKDRTIIANKNQFDKKVLTKTMKLTQRRLNVRTMKTIPKGKRIHRLKYILQSEVAEQ